MQVYCFTVLTNTDGGDADVVDRVYGICDDATATSEDGRLAVAFDREAESLDQAIGSALKQLRRISVGITGVTIDPESLAVLR